MPRVKKDATPISMKMDQATFDRLEAFCRHSGQSKTMAIERAVNMYIDRYNDMISSYARRGQTIRSEIG